MKQIRLLIILFSVTVFAACSNPKQGTTEDKGAVKGDTLNVREGSGEGPVGEGDLGSG